MKTEEELLKRIVMDPKVMVGKPIIKGARDSSCACVKAVGSRINS
jgi:uncharacterized protein (DUF433 family)